MPQSLLALSLLGALTMSAPQAQHDVPADPAEVSPPDEIVVTGTREAEEKTQPLGSRIAREKQADGFVSQIRSETGVAGFTPGSGMDPFAGGTRKLLVKSCKSEGANLSRPAACALAAVQRSMAERDFAAARAGLDRFFAVAQLTDEDRYVASRFAFSLAEAEGDPRDRQRALEIMLSTATMPEAERAPALRTLAALALKLGDDEAAIAALNLVTVLEPFDPRSQANLAALYERKGRSKEARERMATAVALVQRSGAAVPKAWSDYLQQAAR